MSSEIEQNIELSHQPSSICRQLGMIRDCAWFQFGTLMLFALVLNREGTWVPGGNENIYLLYLVKAWRASFLASDWTFQESTAGHPVFNFLFGWPTRFLSLEVFGWIGRVLSWTVLFAGLLRVGQHLKIPSWMVWAGVMLWLIERQSMVAVEWIIGTFEAKCVAYACLLFAIDQILRGKVILPAILTGFAFTIHSAVGLWGGAAIGLAFATQNPIRQTLKFAAWATLFALPGAIASFGLVHGGHSITPDEAKYLVAIEMPFHLDPLKFGAAKIALIYLMLLFNCLHYLANKDDRNLGFLIRFQLFAGGFFLLGILFRITHQFTMVELFPFRVFAVFIMLFFFWQLGSTYYHRRENPPSPVLIALGIVLVLCLPNPMTRLEGLAAGQLPKWRLRDDDFTVAAKWVRDNAPPDAVVIAPPWRKDAFYWTRHPLIADWHVPRFTAMTEWRERIESLVGDLSQLGIEENLAGEMDERAQNYYSHLSPSDLADIRRKYGGDLLITHGEYAYTALFTHGSYTVYKLSPQK